MKKHIEHNKIKKCHKDSSQNLRRKNIQFLLKKRKVPVPFSEYKLTSVGFFLFSFSLSKMQPNFSSRTHESIIISEEMNEPDVTQNINAVSPI